MQNQQWLLIGFSALISGTLTSASLSFKNSIIPVAASTVGAMGVSYVTKRREKETNEKLLNKIAELQNLIANYQATQTLLEKPESYLKTPASIRKKELPDSNFKANNTETVEVISKQPLETFSDAIAWFKARQITIKSYHKSQEIVDKISAKIATFLGQRYNSLQLFYRQLKSHLETGTRFYFKLAHMSQEEINNCINFCNLLFENSFLAHYRYLHKEKAIIVTPQTNAKISNFLIGGWLVFI